MSFLLMGLGRYGLALSAVAGLLVTVAAWRAVDVSKQRNIGVQKEQSRVETVGKKIDAKAATARRAAESKPHDSLRQYYRD